MAKKKEFRKNSHPVFSQLPDMEIGDELIEDVWNIVRVPGGYIVKRLNFETVFIPEKN